MLRDVGERSERLFVVRHYGKPVDVLWESERDGVWHGTSDNYLRMRTRSGSNLGRRMTRSVISELHGNLAFTTLDGDRPRAARRRRSSTAAGAAQGVQHGA